MMSQSNDFINATQKCNFEDSFSQKLSQIRKDIGKHQIGTLSVDSTQYPIYKGLNLIGRGPQCNIRLAHPTVSKKHAEIEASNADMVFINDLNSSNRTILNKAILTPGKSYQILNGNIIRFGEIFLTYNSIKYKVIPETPALSAIQKKDNSIIILSNVDSSLNNSTINETDISSIPPTQADTTNNHLRLLSRSSQQASSSHANLSQGPLNDSLQDQQTQTYSQFCQQSNVEDVIPESPEATLKDNNSEILNKSKKNSNSQNIIDETCDDMFQNETQHGNITQTESPKQSPEIHKKLTQKNIDDDFRRVSQELNLFLAESYNFLDSPSIVEKISVNTSAKKVKLSEISTQSVSTDESIYNDLTQQVIQKRASNDSAILQNLIDENIYDVPTQKTGEEDDIYNAPTQLNKSKSCSNDSSSETDEEGLFESFSCRKKTEDSIQKKSETDDENISQEHVKTVKTSKRMSISSKSKNQSQDIPDFDIYTDATQKIVSIEDIDVNIIHDSDDLPTQVIERNDNSLKNNKSNKSSIDTCKVSRSNLSARKNDKKDSESINLLNGSIENSEYETAATQVVAETTNIEKSNKFVNQNAIVKLSSGSSNPIDMVEKNLQMMFGQEEGDNVKLDSSPLMMTPQLENLLQGTPMKSLCKNPQKHSPVVNRRIASLRLNSSRSSQNNLNFSSNMDDSDSQTYFSALKSRRKRNILIDSSDSEEENQTVSKRTKESPKKQMSFDCNKITNNSEVSKSVGVESVDSTRNNSKDKINITPERVSITTNFKTPIVLLKREKNLSSPAKIESCPETIEQEAVAPSDLKTSSNKKIKEVSKPQPESDEEDILAGLPPVSISNTLSNPASPTASSSESEPDSSDEVIPFMQSLHTSIPQSTPNAKSPKKNTSMKAFIESFNKDKSSETLKKLKLDKIIVSDSDDDMDFKELEMLSEKMLKVDSIYTKMSIKMDSKLSSQNANSKTCPNNKANKDTNKIREKLDRSKKVVDNNLHISQISAAVNKSSMKDLANTSSPRMIALPIERSKNSYLQKEKNPVSPNKNAEQKIVQNIKTKTLSVVLSPLKGNLNNLAESTDEEEIKVHQKIEKKSKSPKEKDMKQISTNQMAKSKKTETVTVLKIEKESPRDKSPPARRTTRGKQKTMAKSSNESKEQNSEEDSVKNKSTSVRVTRGKKKVEVKKRNISETCDSDLSNFGVESQEVQSILNKSIVSLKRLKTSEINEMKQPKEKHTTVEQTKGRKKKIETEKKTSSSTANKITRVTRGKKNTTLDESSVLTPKPRMSCLNISISSPRRAKYKVLFTGVSNVEKWRQILAKLGASEADDISNCTILLTDKVKRTVKFLCSLARGKPIVSLKWLEDSNKEEQLLDWEDYILNDSDAEAKFKFNLKNSLKSANKTRLFDGWTIILTPKIDNPPLSDLKEMIKACDGKILVSIPRRWPENVIIVSNENDLENAKKFASKAPKTVTVQSTEFILTGILRQQVDLKEHKLKF